MDTKYVEKLLERDVESFGCVIWGIEISGRMNSPTLRIFIDKNTGITIEDCEKVSRHISKVLEADVHTNSNFSLEVSSPGIERKVFKLSQYSNFLHHFFKVRYRTKENQYVTEQGILEKVNTKGLNLKSQNKELFINFDSIEKATFELVKE